jgi:LPXTG-motif cell wall-anchored protein
MVPETSLPGLHQVAIKIVDTQMTPPCEDFTVTHTVQEDAYTQTSVLPPSLPSTGLVLLAPIAGFMAMGIGGYIIRKRCI